MFDYSKTNVRRSMAIVMFLSIVVTSGGCAAFHSMEPVSGWPPNPSGKEKSLGISISGLGGDLDASFRKQAMQAYREAGIFSEIRENLRGNTDLRAEIHVEHTGEANLMMAFLTGLTLYIIPSKAWDEYHVETRITNSSGELLGVVEATDRVTLWQQLFLAFLYPFNKPDDVSDDSFLDLNKASILQAHAKGYF